MKLVWLQVIPLLPRDASAPFADLWRCQMCENSVVNNSSEGGSGVWCTKRQSGKQMKKMRLPRMSTRSLFWGVFCVCECQVGAASMYDTHRRGKRMK